MPVEFRVAEANPGQDVLVTASWILDGLPFESSARFEADANGIVAPGDQPSLGGTYQGVEPFGLWWSAPSERESDHSNLEPIVVTLRATLDGEQIKGTIVRLRVDPAVRISAVTDDGMVGSYFRPSGEGPFPAMLVVGGSAGGFFGVDAKAALLASRGIASLALAYFGLPGLPDGLTEIPLEYFATALGWLAARPELKGRVGVMGQSRGGELALLLGASFREVGAVVAQAPSSVVWGSFGPGSGPEVAAWTLKGNAIPWLPEVEEAAWAEVEKTRPLVCTPATVAELSNVVAREEAAIEIEHATCPILMISGKDDALWPSTMMAEQVEERARSRGFIHRLVHLSYPEAGHFCAIPPGLPSPLVLTHPVDHELIAFGGSHRGNAAAQADSWSRTLVFLHEVLAQ